MSTAEAEDPNSSRHNGKEEEEEALEAMMAFQEQQHDVQDDVDEASFEDDPNIVYLNQNQQQQDDEAINNEHDQHNPNMNNPAAIALRARLAQHQFASTNNTPKSLYARVASLFSYTTWSFLSASFLILHTMRTRQQFYLTILYLQSSKLSYIVLGNALIAMGVSTFSFVIKVFLGGLRVNERDAIGEHIRWDVTETCLALTIFRSEMDVATAVRFLWLVVLKW
jgi:E3 ubiquitin-protein ligase synoviolin